MYLTRSTDKIGYLEGIDNKMINYCNNFKNIYTIMFPYIIFLELIV